jgi:hypothetical protein
MNPPDPPCTQVNCNQNCNHGTVPNEATGSAKRQLHGADTCPWLASGFVGSAHERASRTASHTLHGARSSPLRKVAGAADFTRLF